MAASFPAVVLDIILIEGVLERNYLISSISAFG